MSIKKRNPRREAVGVAVSAEDKAFIEEEARFRNQSVSEFLRPGVILGLVMQYMDLPVDEAIERLLQGEVSYDDVITYLSHGNHETAGLYRSMPSVKRHTKKLPE